MDKYEVLKAIGKGKFSIVYRARRRSDDMPVALKRLATDMMDAKSREKCLQEVRLLQSLDHPNVIQYLDSFFDGRELVIVVAWAAAGDLKRQLRKARERGLRFEERVIWKYFAQVCDALAYLHGRRILHRDLTPANVFLTLQGVVKVGDFGLSRLMGEQTIEAHSRVGTPLYMSPEVLRGDGYGWKSDVWSLGCLLYEMAQLHSPFKAEGPGQQNLYVLCEKVSRGEYPPLPEMYSQELHTLAHAMISLDPTQRPDIHTVCRVAHEMRGRTSGRGGGRLRPSLATSNVSSPPPPPPSSSRSSRRRRRLNEVEDRHSREKEEEEEEINVDEPFSRQHPRHPTTSSSSRMMIGLEEEEDGARWRHLHEGMDQLSLHHDPPRQRRPEALIPPTFSSYADSSPLGMLTQEQQKDAAVIARLQRKVAVKQASIGQKRAILQELEGVLRDVQHRTEEVSAVLAGGDGGLKEARRGGGGGGGGGRMRPLVELREALTQLKEENVAMTVKEGILWHRVLHGRLAKAEAERRRRRQKRLQKQQQHQRRRGFHGGVWSAVSGGGGGGGGGWKIGSLAKFGGAARRGGERHEVEEEDSGSSGSSSDDEGSDVEVGKQRDKSYFDSPYHASCASSTSSYPAYEDQQQQQYSRQQQQPPQQQQQQQRTTVTHHLQNYSSSSGSSQEGGGNRRGGGLHYH